MSKKYFRTGIFVILAALSSSVELYGLDAPEAQTLVDSTKATVVKSDPDSGTVHTERNKKTSINANDVEIGYGTMKKENLTGSITVIKADQFERDAVYSIHKALQGKAAGVSVIWNSGQPGRVGTLGVRGVGTIYNSDPLYVVDGTPVYSIEYLNPHDIESISILKDASATAIFGLRGANGVILVTTKKARDGVRAVTYDIFVGTAQPWREPSMCNASEWALLNNEAVMEANRYQTDSSRFVKPFPELANPAILGEGTNWFKEITRKNAVIQSHNVSVAQGMRNLNYFMSGGLIKQQGIIRNSGLDKMMLRLNFEGKPVDWLTLGTNAGFSRADIDYVNEQDEHNSVLIYALSMDPVTQVRDSTGELSGSPYNNVKNPVGRMMYYDYQARNSVFNGSVFSIVDFFDRFTLKTTFNLDMLLRDSTFTIAKYFIAPDDQQEDAFVCSRVGNDKSWILENVLSYERNFNNHSLKLLIGTSMEDRAWDSILSDNSSIPLRTQGTAGGTSLASFFGRMIYDYADKYIVTFTGRRDRSSQFAPNNQWGNFPSAAAAWNVSNEPFMKKLMFVDGFKIRAGWGKTGNPRIDDFLFLNTVPSGQNNPFGENIIPLRTGTEDIHWETTTQTNAGFDMNILGGRIAFNADYYIKRTNDIFIKQQPSAMMWIPTSGGSGLIENRGIELALNYRDKIGSFLTNIGLNFSTYNNEVLSLGSNVPPIMDAVVRNSGTVTRTEVGHPIASFYGLKTNGLFQTPEDVENHTYVDKTTNEKKKLQPNAKPGDIRYRDDNGDGNLDRNFIGSPHPDFTGGLNVDLSYRGFDFGMGFFAMYGNEIFNGVRWYTDNSAGQYGLSSRMLDRWTEPYSTNNANTPRMNQIDATNILLSDRYVEDGSCLRLKTLRIGYSFNGRFLQKLHAKKCRIYFAAENIVTITGYSGLEPEIGVATKSMYTNFPTLSLGVDRGTYPQPKTFMVGCNLAL